MGDSLPFDARCAKEIRARIIRRIAPRANVRDRRPHDLGARLIFALAVLVSSIQATRDSARSGIRSKILEAGLVVTCGALDA